jgi:hypothetical protein
MAHSVPAGNNKELGAPWIDTAQAEIGQTEVKGTKANPRILEYFKASKFWGGLMILVRRMLGADLLLHGYCSDMGSFHRKMHFAPKNG